MHSGSEFRVHLVHKLFIVLAVSTLAYNNCTFWGSHAFSGLDCNHLEMTEYIFNRKQYKCRILKVAKKSEIVNRENG